MSADHDQGWKASSLLRLLRPSRSARHDAIILALIKAGFFETAGAVISFGFSSGCALLWAWASETLLPPSVRIRTGSLELDVVLFWLTFTFFDYWNHRLFHVTALWHLHKTHHSATEMTAINAARNHPVAMAVEPFFRGWGLIFVGLQSDLLGLYWIFWAPYTLFLHSMVRWDFGWFGRWVLASPAGHRVHHSALREHWNKNLSMCPLWDHVFGTWYSGNVPVADFGLGDGKPLHPAARWFIGAWVLELGDFVKALLPTRLCEQAAPPDLIPSARSPAGRDGEPVEAGRHPCRST